MNNCPRCYNSEIGEKDNYCKICGTSLKGEAAVGSTDLKYERVTMSLALPTQLVAFASTAEEYKQLIEKEDWLPFYFPELGEQMGIKAELWIAYKESSASG